MNPEMQDQLYDIYDFWYQPWYQNKYYLSLIIIAGLCLCGLIIWFIPKNWFKKEKGISLPERIAELLSLADHAVQGKKTHVKEGYILLTQAVKLFISEKYNQSLDHFTDVEVQNILLSYVDEKYISQFKELFNRSSRVKFQSGDFSKLDLHDFVSYLKQDIVFVHQFIREIDEQQKIREQ